MNLHPPNFSLRFSVHKQLLLLLNIYICGIPLAAIVVATQPPYWLYQPSPCSKCISVLLWSYEKIGEIKKLTYHGNDRRRSVTKRSKGPSSGSSQLGAFVYYLVTWYCHICKLVLQLTSTQSRMAALEIQETTGPFYDFLAETCRWNAYFHLKTLSTHLFEFDMTV